LKIEKVKAKKIVVINIKQEEPFELFPVGSKFTFRLDSKHRLYMNFVGEIVQVKKLKKDRVQLILENVISSHYDIFNSQEKRHISEEEILFNSEEFK